VTRIELRIDELVLRGVPEEYAAEMAGRIEQQLTELAARHTSEGGTLELRNARWDAVQTRPARAPVEGAAGLASEVARQVWGATVGQVGGAR
jgi:hypothetical protein